MVVEYKCTDIGVNDTSKFRKDMESVLKRNPFCAKNLTVCVIGWFNIFKYLVFRYYYYFNYNI